MEYKTKRTIETLLYLRRIIDNLIDNEITEQVLRGKDVDTHRLKESILYNIKENVERFL